MTVFVVTNMRGEVKGVFLDKAKAHALVLDLPDGYNRHGIEEWDANTGRRLD